jgi:hypothetical protein
MQISGGEIFEADVEHLAKVADAFERSPIQPFLIFSKLSEFTIAEIESCRAAQAKERWRTILLSKHELEPYYIYERFKKSPPLRGSTLEDLETRARWSGKRKYGNEQSPNALHVQLKICEERYPKVEGEPKCVSVR